ncbi:MULTISPECIES: glycosyltransferase family 2 protein [unclassified Moraxella]|uniref:glycosyltransferase family 2 protein n=1 Tax=unclassified Moraxella TaxID=2685852 RepID=UPI003AF9DB0A
MKFSVLMSLYDKEQPNYLQACLQSLVAQTLPADEIVLVFDGSINPHLQQVVNDFKSKLPLKIIALEKNVGLGQALNAGLNQCSHEWVIRMDTDDICVDNRFAMQIAYIEQHPSIDVLGGQIIEFEGNISNGKASRQVPTTHEAILQSAKSRNPINHMTVAFKKSAVLKVGSYRHAPLFEDYDLWVRLLLAGQQFANLPDVLVYARAGEAMYERRGGLDYAKYELDIQGKFYQQGFLTLTQMIKNLAIRLPVRLLPNGLRSWVYQKLLRK